MFRGSIVALVTPFSGTTLDDGALRQLVRFHLENGTSGIVPIGTTGEAPTLTLAEQVRVTEIVIEEVNGRVAVIVGAGSNNTIDAIKYSQEAYRIGADAALHVTGYYNRPSQEGIFQHFAAIEKSVDLPIIVYNVPPRTIVDILPETMARIAGLRNVIGVKDATRDLTRPLMERSLIEGEFCFLTGEDLTAVSYNANGGQGCISVTANVAPGLCAELQAACASGQFREALDIQMRLLPLHEALFLEPSPAGVKYACSLLGMSGPVCRLPITELSSNTKSTIRRAMEGLELI